MSRQEKWFIGLTVGPALIHFCIFTFAPVVFSLLLSFYDWSVLSAPHAVGIANYVELFRDKIFIKSLFNTLVFAALYVPAMLIVSLALAILVNKQTRAARFFRGLYFLPVVTSFVVFAVIFQWVFQADAASFANTLMTSVGLEPQSWLQDEHLALPMLALLGLLKGTAWNMVYFIAGLQGIPETFYEAARVDGAGRWATFRKVTLPLLRPTMFFVLVLTTIGAFQVFDSAYLLTKGGPAYATTTIVYYVYSAGFESFRMGYASAAAYVLLAMVLVVTWVQKRFLGTAADWY